VEATLHLPGDGERQPLGESEVVIKATGEDTGGTFFLSKTTIAPGFSGPPPHWHERLVDMFYVLDGVLRLEGREQQVLQATGAQSEAAQRLREWDALQSDLARQAADLGLKRVHPTSGSEIFRHVCTSWRSGGRR
jgi:hypothetical protein